MSQTRIIGMEQLFATMQAFPKELAAKALNSALGKAAVPIRDAAQALAPKDTGAMANSIRTAKDRRPEMSGMDARYVVFVPWRGPEAAKYWRYTEFGTSLQPPQPYMRPAFDSQKENAMRIVLTELALAIPRIAASLRK